MLLFHRQCLLDIRGSSIQLLSCIGFDYVLLYWLGFDYHLCQLMFMLNWQLFGQLRGQWKTFRLMALRQRVCFQPPLEPAREEPLKRLHSNSNLRALHAKIRLGWKSMEVVNIRAHYDMTTNKNKYSTCLWSLKRSLRLLKFTVKSIVNILLSLGPFLMAKEAPFNKYLNHENRWDINENFQRDYKTFTVVINSILK